MSYKPRPVYPIVFSLFVLIAFSLFGFALVRGDATTAYNTLMDIYEKYHGVRPSTIGNVVVTGEGSNVYYDIICMWNTTIQDIGSGYKRVITNQPSGIVYHTAGVPLVRFSLKFVEEVGATSEGPTVYPLFSLHHRISNKYEFLQAVLKIDPRISSTNYSTDVYIEWKHYYYDPDTGDYRLVQIDRIHRALDNDIYSYWLDVYILPTFYTYYNSNKTLLVFGFRYRVSFSDDVYIDGQLAWTKLELAENKTLDELVNDVRNGLEKIYGWSIWIGLGLVVYREPDLENVKDYHDITADYLEATIRVRNPVVYDFIINSEKLAEKFYHGGLEEYTRELIYENAISGEENYLIIVGVLLAVSIVPTIAIKKYRLAPIISGLLFTAAFFSFVSPDIRIVISYVIGVLLVWKK